MSGYAVIRRAIVVAGILSAMGSVAAAPLVPATSSMRSTAVADSTQIRRRGHGGGGAGLAAGLATGLVACSPRRVIMKSHTPTIIMVTTLQDMSDRSATARPAGRPIAFHVIVRSIPSVEYIWDATADGTIVVSSSRSLQEILNDN